MSNKEIKRMTFVGRYLNGVRVSKKMSIRDLAEKTGFDKKTIHQIMKGKSDPKISTVVAIADVLCLDLIIETREP